MSQEDEIAIFPLPNVVFFPKTILPLHIFEPRYRQMVEDTIENHQLIGMFLLQPGWQTNYYGNPSIFPIGCAGDMIKVEALEEGRFNILLKGLHRVRVREVIQQRPYRRARVEIVPEVMATSPQAARDLRRRLLESLNALASKRQIDVTEITKMKELAEVVNLIAMTVDLDVQEKQELLNENDICARGNLLLEELKRQLSLFEWTDTFSHLRPNDPSKN